MHIALATFTKSNLHSLHDVHRTESSAAFQLKCSSCHQGESNWNDSI